MDCYRKGATKIECIMDIVITYVDGLDPEWQKEYGKYSRTPILEKRFRDWGTLKYLMRGIEKNMPFIRKVHLIVASESQIPAWINKETVNIVLHSDIIPAEYLPTFNCNPIEMYMHRIKGLAEQFLYFNDDMFPVMPCKAEDFFNKGKAVLGISRHLLAPNMYKRICRNSSNVARKATGMEPSFFFMRPQHICSPMLRSVCEELYCKVEKDIKASLTRTREENNLNQYLFLDYMYLKGVLINKRLSKKHFSTGATSAKKLCEYLLHPTRKLICINDVQMSEKRYTTMRNALTETFEAILPHKSRYEQQ